MNNFAAKFVNVKRQLVKNCGFTEHEVFGCELRVLERVSSCKKNSSKTYLMKVNDIGTKQTAYVVDSNIEINKRFESLICEGDKKFGNQQIPLNRRQKRK